MSDLGDEREGEADLAAEYVLGVLDGAERRAAERLARRDPEFAARIAHWSERLGPLADGIAPVEPPPAVWRGIERELDRMSRTTHLSPGFSGAPAGRIGSGVSAAWRWLAIGSSLVAAGALAALILVVVPREASRPGDVEGSWRTATLASPDGAALFTVVVDREGSTATLVPVGDTGAGAAQVPELWLIPPGDEPRSLGLIEPNRPISLPLSDASAGAFEGTLAVSLEPSGGSPTGSPTGPVIASGELGEV